MRCWPLERRQRRAAPQLGHRQRGLRSITQSPSEWAAHSKEPKESRNTDQKYIAATQHGHRNTTRSPPQHGHHNNTVHATTTRESRTTARSPSTSSPIQLGVHNPGKNERRPKAKKGPMRPLKKVDGRKKIKIRHEKQIGSVENTKIKLWFKDKSLRRKSKIREQKSLLPFAIKPVPKCVNVPEEKNQKS